MVLGLLVLLAIAFALPIWAIVDAASRPRSSWEQIGKDKTRWVFWLVVCALYGGLLLFIPTVAMTIVYLTSIRSKLTEAALHPRAVNAARWVVDPTGRFESRYWDGSQWTSRVFSGGVEFDDPIAAPRSHPSG